MLQLKYQHCETGQSLCCFHPQGWLFPGVLLYGKLFIRSFGFSEVWGIKSQTLCMLSETPILAQILMFRKRIRVNVIFCVSSQTFDLLLRLYENYIYFELKHKAPHFKLKIHIKIMN